MSAMLRTLPVDIKGLVTVPQFESYLRPPGKPLIIKGWTQGWRALSTWDFEFFKTNYGEDRISLIAATDDEREIELDVKLKDYVDYILDPTGSSALKELDQTLKRTQPFYCLSYKPFRAHPELLEDFTFPPFVANWWSFFSESFTRTHFPQDQGWIFLGAKNSVAKLHKDSHHTFTWLAQIRGRKTCYLFAPHDAEAIYKGEVDPANPDWDKSPLLKDAIAHVCILNPGEMLFLPADWWHHVIAIDNVITVSYNFVNHINFGDYLRRAFGARLPDLLALLPGELPPLSD
jgi:hypothetical protein